MQLRSGSALQLVKPVVLARLALEAALARDRILVDLAQNQRSVCGAGTALDCARTKKPLQSTEKAVCRCIPKTLKTLPKTAKTHSDRTENTFHQTQHTTDLRITERNSKPIQTCQNTPHPAKDPDHPGPGHGKGRVVDVLMSLRLWPRDGRPGGVRSEVLVEPPERFQGGSSGMGCVCAFCFFNSAFYVRVQNTSEYYE